MAYPINPDDIVEVKVVYAQSQIVSMFNILHYRYTGTTSVADGAAAILDLISYFAEVLGTNGWSVRWANTASSLVNIDRYIGQKVYPVRFGQVDYDVAVPGNVVADPLPGLVQWSITKRGDLATRYSVGGIRVPGLSTNGDEGSEVNAATRPACDQLAQLVRLPMNPTGGVTWAPIVYRRLNAGSSVLVTQSFAQYTLRSQRTRIAFRGV